MDIASNKVMTQSIQVDGHRHTSINKESTGGTLLHPVMRIKCASSSRMNFAANINRQIFTVAERTQCNIRGKLGKGMQDKDKIDYMYIKLIAFRMFPLESSKETEKAAWNACTTAVDEVNRRLNKPPKKKNYLSTYSPDFSTFAYPPVCLCVRCTCITLLFYFLTFTATFFHLLTNNN